MLYVTPEARSELHGMLLRIMQEQTELDSAIELGFRLVIDRSQLGLALDSPRGGEEIVEQDGLSVLILDSAISEFLDNLTLDVVETPDGDRLELRDRG